MITLLSPIHCPFCPVCGTRVSSVATVNGNKPGHPPHGFWGKTGDRALIHNVEGAWCHFRVGDEHRLAYLIEAAKQYMKNQ